MDYMNGKALTDADTALKFALLFSSRSFDALAMHQTKVRSAMLKILETNFMNADIYRVQDKNRLYNSITMLGEYYHRVRLADNSPVTILGESLLELLQYELSQTQAADVRLAKLVLSQITLNGSLLQARHQLQLAQLFFHIRRQLIEQPTLKATVKALLLMTLDMYYSNFANLGKQLEDMYTKYFLQGEQEAEDEAKSNSNNNNGSANNASAGDESVSPAEISAETPTATSNGIHSENGEVTPITKKWSEQVCEDSYENEFDGLEDSSLLESVDSKLDPIEMSERRGMDKQRYHDRQKQHQHHHYQQQQQQLQPQQHNKKSESNEERDQTKPLPRWRTPRFNREVGDIRYESRSGPQGARRNFSGSFDDDQHSVRSEGGSIRLYSINDRLKHSQEKIDRVQATSGGNVGGGAGCITNQHYYNAASIANSNWDRQSQRDDRSERSYISNYERGNHHRRGGGAGSMRPYNNKQIYDKPPRFQKQQQQQQQQQQQHQQHRHTGDKVYSDTWRRRASRDNNSQPPVEHREHNGPESHSRSSSRARTLPRPGKASRESDGYRRRNSQSPERGGHFGRSRQYRDRQHNNHNSAPRYSSQSSLASEASSVFLERRQQRRTHHNHHNHRNINNNNDQPREAQDWQTQGVDDGELVRNARQTTKYMNYLSQK